MSDRTWTPQEVAKHNKPDDCWVIVSGKVYDVTEFLPNHPGGVRLLLNFAGRDATSAFKPFHTPTALTDALPSEKYLGSIDHARVKALKKKRSTPRRKTVTQDAPRVEVEV
ncbi:cytochrome b5 [Wolfiporia cocos MD-104 SS10]|uniref:Cytochrome b5 n=1 Tax=Wolfiporia cocos (strain MD-104) TaxID=742152 RepID=A0A2H3JR09_WOLCO|nr:cytochrome b5 [Wolfiporia cocos MD-104 SS10]